MTQMTGKRVISIVLLLFVALSIGVLITKETQSSADQPEQVAAEERVVAYYFHGKARCVSCQTIEAYTHEALQTGFAGALASGLLEWRTVNIQEPGNEHFIKDYSLASQSVVLVHEQDGRVVEWKKLDRVWTLLRDMDSFILYIQDETQRFMDGLSNG